MYTGVEIFRTGDHTSSEGRRKTYTEADLDRIAAYDRRRHEAPVVIGHPASNAPAYGWVSRVYRDGAVLKADFSGLDPSFVELLRLGRFKKRSISLYPDGTLRHVGFLGAAPPAVKGLRDVAFAEGDAATFDFETDPGILARLRDWLTSQIGPSAASGESVASGAPDEFAASGESVASGGSAAPGAPNESVAPGESVASGESSASGPSAAPGESSASGESVAPGESVASGESSASGPSAAPGESSASGLSGGQALPDGLERRIERLEERLAEKDERISGLTARLEDARRQGGEFARFAEENILRVLPANRERVVAVMSALSGAQPVQFAETGGRPSERDPLELFRELVRALPAQASFGETATRAAAAALPEGFLAHDMAEKIRAKHRAAKPGMTFAKAQQAVLREAARR